MDSIFEIGTISVCGLAVLLVSLFVAHFLATWRDRIRVRRERGQEFISAFKPELDALKQSNKDCRLILTGEAFLRHEAAVRAFVPYLSWIKKCRIKRAWKCLASMECEGKKHVPQLDCYTQYADCGSLTKRQIARPIAIERIDKILSFAIR